MDELFIIIIIVVLCVSVFAGWLASIACCPDQAMACLGNGSKKSQSFRIKDDKSLRKMTTDSSEYGYNELEGIKGNIVVNEESNGKGENGGSENDQTRLIKKEELLRYTQKHPEIYGSSSGVGEECDPQMMKPHLIKRHESTDVIEYAIVDYNALVAVTNQQDEPSPNGSINSGDIIVEDDDDLLVSCALEDSRDNITESINYPYKFQEHHLSLLTYDPMKRRESLPIPINHNRLSPTRDVIKAV